MNRLLCFSEQLSREQEAQAMGVGLKYSDNNRLWLIVYTRSFVSCPILSAFKGLCLSSLDKLQYTNMLTPPTTLLVNMPLNNSSVNTGDCISLATGVKPLLQPHLLYRARLAQQYNCGLDFGLFCCMTSAISCITHSNFSRISMQAHPPSHIIFISHTIIP